MKAECKTMITLQDYAILAATATNILGLGYWFYKKYHQSSIPQPTLKSEVSDKEIDYSSFQRWYISVIGTQPQLQAAELELHANIWLLQFSDEIGVFNGKTIYKKAPNNGFLFRDHHIKQELLDTFEQLPLADLKLFFIYFFRHIINRTQVITSDKFYWWDAKKQSVNSLELILDLHNVLVFRDCYNNMFVTNRARELLITEKRNVTMDQIYVDNNDTKLHKNIIKEKLDNLFRKIGYLA